MPEKQQEQQKGFQCPQCGRWGDDQVIDTRKIENVIQRTRRCSCGHVTKTTERCEIVKLYVHKSDRSREYYSEEKVRGGLVSAFAGIPVDSADLDDIVGRITIKAHGMGRAEVQSQEIGEWILSELQQKLKDQEYIYAVPFIRFALIFRRMTHLYQVQKFVTDIDSLVHHNAQ